MKTKRHRLFLLGIVFISICSIVLIVQSKFWWYYTWRIADNKSPAWELFAVNQLLSKLNEDDFELRKNLIKQRIHLQGDLKEELLDEIEYGVLNQSEDIDWLVLRAIHRHYCGDKTGSVADLNEAKRIFLSGEDFSSNYSLDTIDMYIQGFSQPDAK